MDDLQPKALSAISLQGAKKRTASSSQPAPGTFFWVGN